MTTPLSIRAIRECKTFSEGKAILADRRKTLAALINAYGEDHATTKLIDVDYWAMSDELAELVRDGTIINDRNPHKAA